MESVIVVQMGSVGRARLLETVQYMRGKYSSVRYTYLPTVFYCLAACLEIKLIDK